MRRLNMPLSKTARDPSVTDHAVLRWLERALEFDVAALRRSILSPTVVAAIRMGASAVHLRAEGVTLVIAPNGAIKTVLPLSRGCGVSPSKPYGQPAGAPYQAADDARDGVGEELVEVGHEEVLSVERIDARPAPESATRPVCRGRTAQKAGGE